MLCPLTSAGTQEAPPQLSLCWLTHCLEKVVVWVHMPRNIPVLLQKPWLLPPSLCLQEALLHHPQAGCPGQGL